MSNIEIIDENHIISERKQKLAKIKEFNNAYPNSFKPEHKASELIILYAKNSNEDLEQKNVTVKVAGRIMLKRIMGKGSFVTVQDNMAKIQLYFNVAQIGEQEYNKFKQLDMGDIIGVCGKLFKTKTNELTINVTHYELIVKGIRPLPEKFHGLIDTEHKYRQRYLDLIMNKSTQNVFITRSKIIQLMRSFLMDLKYFEVETPMMHVIPGGATAKPFVTHHNALDMSLYLRVAPELYLKRLIIGGIDKVFEINRNFRNEGLSTRHNPEFTMLECYESYANYNRMMELTEDLLKYIAIESIGALNFVYQEKSVTLETFDKLNMVEAIIKYNSNYTIDQLNNKDFLILELNKLEKSNYSNLNIGVLQLKLFEHTTETKLWNPTFIIDYPIDVSPLARASDLNPQITERFELFIVGRELANGYSELNDPEEQSKRFKLQSCQMEQGDEEAMHYDADYIKALEYGMPHTGGLGIGIDRLVMLFTNSSSIKDVILFPHMRKE